MYDLDRTRLVALGSRNEESQDAVLKFGLDAGRIDAGQAL